MLYILGLVGAVVLFGFLVRAKGKEEKTLFDELRGAGFIIDEVYRMRKGMLIIDRQNRKASFYDCSGYLEAPIDECRFPITERGFKGEHRFSFDDVVGGEITKVIDPKYHHLSITIKARRYYCRAIWPNKAPTCTNCYYKLWGSTHEKAISRFTKLFSTDFGQNVEVTERPFIPTK